MIMMRLSSLLPGISAGARLGISEWEREPRNLPQAAPSIARQIDDRSELDRLPPREDAFYWSLMHSHL